MTPDEHATRIRALGLPEVVVPIALEGGGAVHPLLAGHADSVWAPAWSIVEAHPDLVPLWSAGTVAVLAAPNGTVYRWSAELPAEPSTVYPDLAAAVRDLLTDLWELDDEGTREDERRSVARLLLSPESVETALKPIDRV